MRLTAVVVTSFRTGRRTAPTVDCLVAWMAARFAAAVLAVVCRSLLVAFSSAFLLRWAPTRDVKDAVERVFVETFGPKTAAKPPAKV